MPELKTSRLRLCPYQPDQACLIHTLISDKRVFFWRNTPGTLEEAVALLAVKSKLYEERRLGWWGVFDRKRDHFLGQVILQPLEDTEETEIGYHFHLHAQGAGYATEAASRLLEYGFRDLKLDRICAVILPENKKSQAVMKRLGLPYRNDRMNYGLQHHFFALDRVHYMQQQDG